MEAVAAKIPFSERFNFRILLFAGLLLIIIGYPAYIYLDGLISGGVKDLGNGVKLVDLKFMSSFVFDQSNGKLEDVPEQWRALNGKKVALEGEMWNGNSASPDLPSWQLCYSVAKCCFSGPPQVQHFVDSHMANGSLAPYLAGKVRMVGTLHVNVVKDPDANKVVSVFSMEVDNLSPVE